VGAHRDGARSERRRRLWKRSYWELERSRCSWGWGHWWKLPGTSEVEDGGSQIIGQAPGNLVFLTYGESAGGAQPQTQRRYLGHQREDDHAKQSGQRSPRAILAESRLRLGIFQTLAIVNTVGATPNAEGGGSCSMNRPGNRFEAS
jgi:hypothetical protein